MISFLAHQAWLMGDAIARTLTRLFVTRRHLLEWVPAAQAAIGPRLDLLRLLSPDGRRDRHRRCGGDRRFRVGARDLAARVAVRGALDRLAGDRPLDEPISCRGGQALNVPWRRPGPAPDRPADLAVLRDLRDAGRSDAAAGQFPGRSGAGVGA